MSGDLGPVNVARNASADGLDTILVALFLFGIATGIAVNFAAGVPIPAVLAGAAGAVLLIKNLDRIGEGELQALVAVIMIYLLSILCAGGSQYLHERTKGLVQLVYSLVIAYALFLTALRYDRRSFARIFLVACLLIVVGAALENYTGFRAISDAFRQKFYDFGVYRADLRDQILYGRIRPKLFTSEPSALTFAYTLFAFLWYVLSPARAKILGFLALLAAGYYLMRGPTLLLGLPLASAYELLLAPRRPVGTSSRIDGTRVFAGLMVCAVLVAVFAVLGSTLYAERLSLIAQGADPSFFSRELGPFLVAKDVLTHHPIAGAGVTGEEYIAERVRSVYLDARNFSGTVTLSDTAHVVTNYFWSHWIYLGFVFGTATLVALSYWLRVLGAPSLLFCWTVWVLFGQASGAYVSPKTWSVLLLACAVAVLHERQPILRVPAHRRSQARNWRVLRPVLTAQGGTPP